MPNEVAKKHGWVLRKREIVDENPWSLTRRDFIDTPEGEVIYTYLVSPGAVFIVPVTQQGQFVLVKTFRWTIDEEAWEVPAGVLADREGMSPQDVAISEMEEEAGCVGGNVTHLGDVYSANGIADLKLHLYLATNVKRSANRPDEGEKILEIREFSRKEIEVMIDQNKISDGDSVLALLWAMRKLPSG